MDVLPKNDLYGQRHIAYFDLACKFDHVESIEQLENEDLTTRQNCNGHRLKNVSSSERERERANR